MTLPARVAPGRPPHRTRLRRTISAGLAASLWAGMATALLPVMYAAATPLDRKPSQAARIAGVTASGGGFAGWALRARPAVRANAVAATPAGVRGIDVASYQGNVNWSSWYSKGIRWAYVKATEGTSYTNPYFSSQYTGSYKQGMPRGAPPSPRPDAGTGAGQARYFVAHGGGRSGDGRTLPGALDIEDNYTGGPRCWGNTDAEN